MIKKHLKLLIATSIIILLPIIVGIILWDKLPNEIPVHWNTAGEADNFSNKPFAVFGFPLILLIVQWGCIFATLADPKKKNHSSKMRYLIFWLIPVLSLLLALVTYCAALGVTVPVGMVASLFIGILFVILGTFLPNCKQNYTIGIKIPWTLHSEENWNRTHRLACPVWITGGIVIALAGVFDLFWLMIAALFGMVLLPIVYSYILYRKGI